MKIGVVCGPLVLKNDFPAMCQWLAENGFEAVDMRSVDWAEKATIEGAGLAVGSFSAPSLGRALVAAEDKRREAVAAAKEQLQQAVSQITHPAQLEDPALQQHLQQIANQPPPQDPQLATIFKALPVDEEPLVAGIRAYELGLAVSAASYGKHGPEWQQGLTNEYLAMRQAAGIVTLAEAQQAEQSAAETASSIEAKAQETELQIAQIRADAEKEKVKMTQEGSLQKELVKAGAPPGAQFPETTAPPTLDGADQNVPGVTGDRALPGIPN